MLSLFLSAFRMQLMIQLAFRCKDLNTCMRTLLPFDILLRILFTLLLLVEVAHAVDDLLQTLDPLVGLLLRGGHQVQVFLAVFEDDREALVFLARLSVFFKPFRLTAFAHRFDVINRNCLERGGEAVIQTFRHLLQSL